MKKYIALALLTFGSAWAYWNGHQPNQVMREGYKARTGTPAQYDIGRPAGITDSEIGVVLQFDMSEASGSIFDEVGAVEVAPVGSPSYNDTDKATGLYSNFVGIDTTSGEFSLNSIVASAEAGSGVDIVWEVWAHLDSTTTTDYFFSFYEAGTTDGCELKHNSDNTIGYYLEATNGANDSGSMATSDDFDDNSIHKVRVVYDRDSATGLEIFLDGASLGTANLSARSTLTYRMSGVEIGANAIGGDNLAGAIYGVRQINGRVTANAKGPGGG